MMKVARLSMVAVTLAAVQLAATAQTTVTEPWVRGTVAAQKATGLFATLTSKAGGRLVAVSSPLAGAAEIHAMSMDGDVMRMRPMPALELPAGQAVALKPGGYHVMLLGLTQPLQAGQTVPLTLVVEGRDGRRESIAVQAPVRPLGGAAYERGKR